jgi:hypothetical protein
VIGVAAVLAAILIAASQVGARGAQDPIVSAPQPSLFAGIEQHGASPDAAGIRPEFDAALGG